MVDEIGSNPMDENRGGSSPSTPTIFYSSEKRNQEKQLAREQDEQDLKSGKITKEKLRKKNGFFSSLNIEDSEVILKRG